MASGTRLTSALWHRRARHEYGPIRSSHTSALPFSHTHTRHNKACSEQHTSAHGLEAPQRNK
eukprot:4151415-Alexandrium_andersonii.AAC.1